MDHSFPVLFLKEKNQKNFKLVTDIRLDRAFRSVTKPSAPLNAATITPLSRYPMRVRGVRFWLWSLSVIELDLPAGKGGSTV